MNDEKPAVGGNGDLQLESGVAELRDSPDVQPDVGRVAAVAPVVNVKPELAFFLMSDTGHCSEDPGEFAEAIYLGRLDPKAAMWFKAHSETCLPCRQVYEEAVEFVDAIRAADKELESGDCSKVN